MSCAFAHDAGAYVVGSLSPADRLAFEEHRAGCAECSAAVHEFAGLPGLLARVDSGVLEHPPAVDPPPDTLLPALARAVRRTRRTRRLLTLGAAAAAIALVAALGFAVLHRDTDADIAAVGRQMTPVGTQPVTARLALEPVAWGTRLDLECRYAADGGSYGGPRAVTYSLVIRTRDGRTEQVGTWRSVEGKTMHLSAATAAPREDIASVEVRLPDGRPVLTLRG